MSRRTTPVVRERRHPAGARIVVINSPARCRRSRGWLFVGSCLAWAAVTLSAAGPERSETNQTYSLPPVVVSATNSARPTAEPVPPPSASAVSTEQLQDAGAATVIELPRLVPNLTISSTRTRSYADNYALRGLVNLEFLGTPAVAIYVDDVPLGNAGNYKGDLLTVERVEIFRGPQGARFGNNSEAGVLNIVTRQPGERWEASAAASYATFNAQSYQAQALGPVLSNKLSLSLGGQYTRTDGFIRNSFLRSHADHQEGINGRAVLGWTPSEAWDIRFTATGDRYRDGQTFTSLAGDPRRSRASFDGIFRETDHAEALRVRGALSALELVSITARRSYRLDPWKFDSDFSPLAGNTGTVRRTEIQWSEELRLRPRIASERWDWHAGLFFSTTEEQLRQTADFFIPPVGPSGRDVLRYQSDSDTYALFGELTRNMRDRLDLTLGLRLDYTTREFSRANFSTLGSRPARAGDKGFFHAAPKLSLAYQIQEPTVVYASSGLGFRPGGFSPFIEPPASPAFDAETVWANELGLKAAWWDERLSARAAVFYNDVFDYQVAQYAPNAVGLAVVNAPRGRTYGAEVELTARPWPGWELAGFFGHTEARVNRVADPFTNRAFRDRHPPFVAAFNGGASVQYRHAQGWFGRVHFSALGDTYADLANTSAFKQSAFGLLGTRLGFEGRHFSVAVFGENLTDTEYYAKKIASLNAGAPGTPQTLGVRLTASY